jgi:alpha-galactosidase
MTEPTRYPAKPQRSISRLLFRSIGDQRSRFSATAAICALLFASAPWGHSQMPGIAERPYQGWTSFSQQTISSNFLTQANMAAQSDALLSSGLQPHGFDFSNIDSGWQGSFVSGQSR